MWYGVLKAIRDVVSAKGGDPLEAAFTAEELAEEAGMAQSKSGASPSWIASAWLGKFVRWGYVVRGGKAPNVAGRAVQTYRITAWGMKKYAPKGKQGRRVAKQKGKR